MTVTFISLHRYNIKHVFKRSSHLWPLRTVVSAAELILISLFYVLLHPESNGRIISAGTRGSQLPGFLPTEKENKAGFGYVR